MRRIMINRGWIGRLVILSIVMATISIVGIGFWSRTPRRGAIAAGPVFNPPFRAPIPLADEEASRIAAGRVADLLNRTDFDENLELNMIELARVQYMLGAVESGRLNLEKLRSRLEKTRESDRRTLRSYWRLGHTQVELGDWPGARASLQVAARVDRTIADPLDQMKWWRLIIADQFAAGDRPSVRESLKCAEETYLSQPESSFKRFLLAEYAGVRASARDLKGAFNAVETLLADDESMHVYAAEGLGLIAESIRYQDPIEVIPAMNRVMRLIGKVLNTDYRALPLGKIAVAWARTGDYAKALGTVASIGLPRSESGRTFSDQRIESLLKIADQARSEDRHDQVKAALAAAKKIDDEDVQPPSLTTRKELALAAARNGDLKTSQSILESLPIGHRAPIYRAISVVKLREGDATANSLLELARQDAIRTLIEPSKHKDHKGLYKMIRPGGRPTPADDELSPDSARIELALVEEAGRSPERAIGMIATIRDESLRSEATKEVAALAAMSGDPAQSLEWIRQIDDQKRMHAAVSGLLEGLLERRSPRNGMLAFISVR